MHLKLFLLAYRQYMSPRCHPFVLCVRAAKGVGTPVMPWAETDSM